VTKNIFDILSYCKYFIPNPATRGLETVTDEAQPAPRRRQKRAIETRTALLDTATGAFSARGFEGISIRQIEELAGVKRGLVGYHFSDKDQLWRAVVDRLFSDLARDFAARMETLQDIAPGEAAGALIRAFVRYSASHPELNRLMMQESMSDSWRVDYIVEHHIRPQLETLARIMPTAAGSIWGELDPHRYYTFIGASAFVFTAEQECRRLFGTSPRTEDFVERHADLVVQLLLRN
jgi:AcrR family transcriptional regulator